VSKLTDGHLTRLLPFQKEWGVGGEAPAEAPILVPRLGDGLGPGIRNWTGKFVV
jgi:hypothetical protein